MSSTYGAWLPGDPRGFRTRGHREHVEGDYRSPPPQGRDTELWERSKGLLKGPPVILCAAARVSALALVRQALVSIHQLDVLAISVSGTHLHLLARFPAGEAGREAGERPTAGRRGLQGIDPVRFYMGVAKERSAKGLAAEGLVVPGRVWARKGKIVRVRDRAHQVRVYRYILDHAGQGAAVWSFTDEGR